MDPLRALIPYGLWAHDVALPLMVHTNTLGANRKDPQIDDDDEAFTEEKPTKTDGIKTDQITEFESEEALEAHDPIKHRCASEIAFEARAVVHTCLQLWPRLSQKVSTRWLRQW